MKRRPITPLTKEKAGVPKGGTAGQFLSKATSKNYDTTWAAGGGGTGTVTSITATGPITVTPTPLVATGVISTSVTTNKLLGRATAGTGVAEEITLGTNLSYTGTTLNAAGGGVNTTGLPVSGNLTKFSGASSITNGDLTGDVTTSGTLATTIAAGAVTLADQANVATSSLFYRKTAGSGPPEVNTLATVKTDLGLTGTNSGDQTITLTTDVTGSGTGSFAATIANAAVTYAKQQNISAASLLIGRGSAAGAGVHQEIALGTNLSMSGTTLNASSGGAVFAPPITQNDETTFTVPDTGRLLQPDRLTVSSTERATLAGTGRVIAVDTTTSNNPVLKGAYNPGQFTVRAGEYVLANSRMIVSGNDRASLSEDARIIDFDQTVFAGSANPTALLGLTAINGAASTAMRSDGAPALDQSIVPTWTGVHAWKITDAVNNSTTTTITLGHNPTGAAAIDLGTKILFQAKDAVGNDSSQGWITSQWGDAGAGTQVGYMDFGLRATAAGIQSGMRLFQHTGSQGGLSVGNTTDPGSGTINATAGYWVNSSASTSGKILQSDGLKFKDSTPTWPITSGTAGNVMRSDGTNFLSVPLNLTDLTGYSPRTVNDYGAPNIPDTGNLNQPNRMTVSSTNRATLAGTGRSAVFDPSGLPYHKGAFSPGAFIIKAGEYVLQYLRLAISGNDRATLTEDARLVTFGFGIGGRLVLAGAGGGA